MLIVYNLATLVVEHCVHASGPDYKAFVESDPERGCVEIEGSYRPDQVGVEVIDGHAQAIIKEEFPFDVPAGGVVGEELHISGIPGGTEIRTAAGSVTMDAAGILDLAFEYPGAYELVFSHPQFVRLVSSIEVSA